MKSLLIALVAGPCIAIGLVLAGCATNGPTAAQTEFSRMQAASRDAIEKQLACRKPIDANPRYAKIYQNYGVGVNVYPSAAQLANTEKLAEEDLGIGFDWYAELEQCDTELAQGMGRIDPALGALMVGAIRDSTEIVIDIVGTEPRPTIGSINAKILSYKNRLKVQSQEWGRRTMARLKAEHQEEIAVRQRNAEAAADAVNVLMAGLQILAQRQASIANAQQVYIAVHPTYVSRVRVSKTNCQFVGKVLTCTQVRF